MLRRLATNTRGVALVEFAICLPVLLLLYLGGCCLSDMLACNRKVTTATRTLVDLVARTMSPTIVYNDPQSANAKSYLSASAVVLSPYKLDAATEQVSLLRVCDATHAYVVWTQAQTQNVDGSVVRATTPDQTAGTLPANQAQAANTVIPILTNMVISTMVPTSPDGSNVCKNLAPGTATKTQVGTAGGWLYMGKISYSFTPSVSYLALGPVTLKHTIYMIPRLY
ncbi:hypothetical protein EWE75_19370 [Sphingomonas populi]|uniref:TadE-like domain-containing protein n=1 Tax=Sphingomonas populi TaxID=2484750 RepID=A0A4Q6XUJ5_9SPHN|nr:TadE/TadG family type IV pilus assembly protein [Sphingomonas populi]RZF61164.1 hypothetical protein EWE75_19370 [Sphingomonas populi]